MKRILFLLLLLPFFASSQKYKDPTLEGVRENRFRHDSVLQLPIGLTGSNNGLRTKVAYPSLVHGYDTAQIRYTIEDSSTQIWTGWQWLKLGGGGGVTTNIYTANGILQGSRILTGLNNTRSLTFDSLDFFSVNRAGAIRMYMNSTMSSLYSPNGVNSLIVDNNGVRLTYNGGVNYIKFLQDSTLFFSRASYEGNIHSTFRPFSLVDKSYVDSLFAALGIINHKFGHPLGDYSIGEDRYNNYHGLYGHLFDSIAYFNIGLESTIAGPGRFKIHDNLTGNDRFIVSATSIDLYSPNQTRSIRLGNNAMTFSGLEYTDTTLYVLSIDQTTGETYKTLKSSIVASPPSLTATYVGFGSGSNLLTGTNKLTYDAGVLSVGNTLANNGRLDVGYARLLEFASVSTPPASSGHVYAKNDGTIHYINSAGTDYDLTTGGSGETNTASNLGGGLANYSTKVGVDLRFNSFSSSHFDLTSNLISIKSSVALPGNPTTTTQSQNDNSIKIATTAYTDLAVSNAVAAVNPATAVQAATTSASNTSGLTYSNGVSGIGATFTGSINTAITFDGYTFTAVGQRALIKNDTQSPSGAFNGMYYVTQVQTVGLPPILTRALDYDMPSDINNTGAIAVQFGTVNGGSSWLLTSQVTTVGTDPLTYIEFTYPASSLVTTSRNINTGPGFLGGGSLASDLTLKPDTTTGNAGALATKDFTKHLLDSLQAAGWGQQAISQDYKYYVDMSNSTIANGYFSSSGAGSSATVPTTVPYSGWFYGRDLNTGPGSTNRAYCISQNLAYTPISINTSLRFRCGTIVRFEDLSTGSERFGFMFGFIDDVNDYASVVDGIGFRYLDSDSSGNFIAFTKNNSTIFEAPTNVTVAADTEYFLQVENIGATFYFYINGVLKASISTNIPTGTTRVTSLGLSIFKSIGTTARHLYVSEFGYDRRFN